MVGAITKAMIPDLETHAATLYPIPYWPYWLPVLRFLYNHQAEVIQLAPQHVAEIAGTWLQRGHESWVLRQEVADLALALAEPIFALTAKREICEHRGQARQECVSGCTGRGS